MVKGVEGVAEMVDGSYKQPLAAAGFERALGSMLQQVSEQFMAVSREYDEAALERGMEGDGGGWRCVQVENVWVKDIVAFLVPVSIVQEIAEEFRQMKDIMESIKVDQGAIKRKVGEMRAGMTKHEVRDIVSREVVNILDGRNVTKTTLRQM